MQVAYEVRATRWGYGIYAAQPIKRGAVIWDAARSKGRVVYYKGSEAQVLCARLDAAVPPAEEVKHLLECAYFDGRGQLVDLRQDDGKYFNHDPRKQNIGLGSFPPAATAAAAAAAALALRSPLESARLSVKPLHPHVATDPLVSVSVDDESTYALRNILAGEELLDDYNTYGKPPDWYESLMAKHGVGTSYLGRQDEGLARKDEESRSGTLAIPHSVTQIGSYAFANSYCSALASVAIPHSVTQIGGNAFRGCSSLASVAIPYSVTEIGNEAPLLFYSDNL